MFSLMFVFGCNLSVFFFSRKQGYVLLKGGEVVSGSVSE